MSGTTEEERRALGWLALGAVAVMLFITRHIAVGIVLGALTAFLFRPLYGRLLQRFRRAWLAQLVCLSAAFLGLTLALLGISTVVVTRGVVMGRELVVLLQPHGGLRAVFERLGERLRPLGLPPESLVDKLQELATSAASLVAQLAGTIAAGTAAGLLTLFLLLLSMSFVLARGHELGTYAERMLPLSPRHTRAILDELRRVGRATLLGTLVTGVAQGLCAGLIYLVVGLPEPLFFGVVTAVGSLLPGVGTMLVWLPAGIYFLATGHVTRGVVEIAASVALIIGLCDYVVRPRLVGSESMPALLTFASLFGGVEVFGLVGLIVGPLLMSLAIVVLRLYRAEVLATSRGS